MVVRQVIETSVTISAVSRPVGGADVTAMISAKQLDDADLLAVYRSSDPLLEVELMLDWPYFVSLAGEPQGCYQWRATERVCVLRFSESPPGPAKAISATFEMPTEPPPVPVDRRRGRKRIAGSGRRNERRRIHAR